MVLQRQWREESVRTGVSSNEVFSSSTGMSSLILVCVKIILFDCSRCLPLRLTTVELGMTASLEEPLLWSKRFAPFL